MFKYIEIVEKENDKVIERFDVSNDDQREISLFRATLGMSFNFKEYKILTTPSDVELKLKP